MAAARIKAGLWILDVMCKPRAAALIRLWWQRLLLGGVGGEGTCREGGGDVREIGIGRAENRVKA